MDGFAYIAIGMFVVLFAAPAVIVAAGILTSPRGRTWQGRLLAVCAVLGAVALAVIAWTYLIG